MKRVAILILAGVSACGSDDDGMQPSDVEPIGTRLVWDPAGGKLGVYPDDAFTVVDPATRTGVRIQIDPLALPELAKLTPNLRDVFGDLNTLDGFGVTAGIALRFEEPIDPASLTSGPATADWSAPIVLVTLDADGPTLHGYEVQPPTDGNTQVILEPLQPLPAKTEAFVVVTSKVRDADGLRVGPSAVMQQVLDGDDTGAAAIERIAPRIRAAAEMVVERGGGTADDIAGAVVFTTQSLHEEALAIAADVNAREIHAEPGITCTATGQWRRCDGRFVAVDYRGDDELLSDVVTSSTPSTDKTYSIPFTVWLPLESVAKPKTGYPTFIFTHGIGGTRSQAEFLASYAAPRGLATVAIDAVFHGQHPTTANASGSGATFDFFAISLAGFTFEPLNLREHFRQSTFDQLQLARMIELGLDLDGDQSADLDNDRLMFMGLSLGGVMGPALMGLEPSIKLGIIAMGGGRVANIVRDSQNFMPLIDLVRPIEATDGDVARFFPVIQTLLDRGEPMVWGEQLLTPTDDRPAGFPASAPHILMEMVIDDGTVPNSANRALARGLGLTHVPPMLQEVTGVTVSDSAPLSGNLPDGRTAGLLQFDHINNGGGATAATHSNVIGSTVGVKAWLTFVESWLENGEAVVVNPYAELGI